MTVYRTPAFTGAPSLLRSHVPLRTAPHACVAGPSAEGPSAASARGRRAFLSTAGSAAVCAALACGSGASAGEDASGLQVEDVTVGGGAAPEVGQQVRLHYTLWLGGFPPAGRVVDSSRGRRALRYRFGKSEVVRGWDDAVGGMKVGGVRRAVVPSALGYGERAVGPIPAGSTLYFEMELLGVGPG